MIQKAIAERAMFEFRMAGAFMIPFNSLCLRASVADLFS